MPFCAVEAPREQHPRMGQRRQIRGRRNLVDEPNAIRDHAELVRRIAHREQLVADRRRQGNEFHRP